MMNDYENYNKEYTKLNNALIEFMKNNNDRIRFNLDSKMFFILNEDKTRKLTVEFFERSNEIWQVCFLGYETKVEKVYYFWEKEYTHISELYRLDDDELELDAFHDLVNYCKLLKQKNELQRENKKINMKKNDLNDFLGAIK